MSFPLDKEQLETIRRTVAVLKSSRELMEYIGIDFSFVPAIQQHAGKAIVEIEMLSAILKGLLKDGGAR